MKKNLIIVDLILLLTKKKDIEPSIKEIIENDDKNDYRFISEESILVLEHVLEQIKVKGFYTDSGCVYYEYRDTEYILEYKEEKLNDLDKNFEILLGHIHDYTLPYKKPHGMIIKGDYYYYISLVGVEHPQTEVLYNLFPIELYKEELKLKLKIICFELSIEIEIIDIGNIGFYLIPKEYKKQQIISKLPFQDYDRIIFLGNRNSHNRELMDNEKIYELEIKNIKELKYFLKTL